MQNDQVCRDNTFGPWAGSDCRGGFDFTLLFEDTILSILLSSIFILAAPVRILRLWKSPPKVQSGLLAIVKEIFSFLFCALSLCLVALWAAYNKSHRSRATIPSTALLFVASLLCTLLSLLEHRRSIRPSFLLSVFLGLSILLDLPRVRTLWLLHGRDSNVTAGLFTANFAIRLGLLIAESIEKGSILLDPFKTDAKESLSGPLSKAFFAWLNPLILKGYRQVLEIGDLFSLDKELQSSLLRDSMTSAWSKVPDQTAAGALFFAWIKTFRLAFMLPVVPRLCVIGFTYAQPFLITAAISVASSPERQPYNNYGYGLIGAFFLVYTGNAISLGQYTWRCYRVAAIMRGSLVSLIYDKALKLDSFSGEVSSPTSTLTLASTDIEVITTGIVQLHLLWSNLVEIGIAIYLLERQLGIACTMVVGLTFVVLIGTSILAIPVGSLQAAWNEASQTRVSTTSTILNNIKWIKISGLTDISFDVIRRLRQRELAISQRFRYFTGLIIVFGSSNWYIELTYDPEAICTPLCGPFLTFAMFTGLQHSGDSSLNISRAFTSLTILYLANTPLTSFVTVLGPISSAFASFQRIQNFLNAPERKDMRIQHAHHHASLHIQNANDDVTYDKEVAHETTIEFKNPHTPCQDLPSNLVGSIEGQFKLPSAASDSKSGEGAQNDDNVRNTDAVIEKLTRLPILDISPALTIPRHAMTLVLGPVGCGKSTLLKALLGELPDFEGTINMGLFDSVAYCDQSPWLQNDTIKSVVIGARGSEDAADMTRSMDVAWYQRVVKACELNRDIETWPEGDLTQIGTRGVALSGGQKQRLALARAIYSRRNLLILDDVYSALDAKTEDLVFENLHGSSGILRERSITVILASSDVRRAPYADKLVLLNSRGQVEHTGNPSELKGLISNLDWNFELGTRADVKHGNKSDDKSHLASKKAVPNRLKTTSDSARNNADFRHLIPSSEGLTDAARRGGDSAVYLFYAKAAGWTTLLTFSVSMAVFAFCDGFQTIWLKWWAVANEKNPREDVGKWLGVYSVFVAGAILSCLVALWELNITVINRSGIYFHHLLADKVSQASMKFHTTTDVGTTVNRFSQDLQLIDMELPTAVLLGSVSVSFGVAQIVITCATSRYMAIFIPFLALVFYILGHVYLRTGRQLRLLDIAYKAPLYTQLLDTAAGVITIRSFGLEMASRKQYLQAVQASQGPFYLLFCAQRWLEIVVNMIIMVFAVILVVFATQLREQLGPGSVAVALSNVLSFNATAQLIIQAWVQLEISLGAVARVRTFAERSVSEDENAAKALLAQHPGRSLHQPDADSDPSKSWPIQGAIQFQQVCASYVSSSKVLDQVTFSIDPGQKVAICGRTGSGKSSLFLSVLGMLDLDSGTIHIDGEDLATLPREYIRKRVVAVPQETFIFEKSVRFNVNPSFSGDWSMEREEEESTGRDDEVISCLKDVGLWETIQSLGGLDTKMHGKLLSHGQVQLLALARAIMRRTSGRVLLLDEVTSSLDESTRVKIDKIVSEQFKEWTVLAIGHRVSSVLDYDRVAVLDAGKLVEFGEPRKLLAQEDSWFKELYSISA